MSERLEDGSGAEPVQGTQSFVGTLSSCWRRPSLTLLEVAWRWVYGIPAASVLFVEGRRIFAEATEGSYDPGRLGLDPQLLRDPVGALSADPLGATGKFAQAIGLLLPGVERVAVWLLPVLLVGWIVVSSVGRGFVLRRADGRLHRRLATLMGLQTIRIGALSLLFFVWFRLLGWSSRVAITAPIAQGAEPNLVLYSTLLILLTLGLFTLWSFLSWLLSIAPLLAMLSDLGVGGSLRAASRIGALKARLVEINLTLGIVKIALIVLAMVFSATPLPFEAVTTPEFLGWWWAGVTLLYLVWSDFFHVARLVAYLHLWRIFEDRNVGGKAGVI